MQISDREVNGIKVYTVAGRVDSEGCEVLDSALCAAVEGQHYKLVLDMTDVPYVNSAALRTLAEIISTTREHGGDLRLAALQPKVKRVLQIVGFDRYSALYGTVGEALVDF